jgi:Transglutaminase-like superfamily
MQRLADATDPTVQATAARLVAGESTTRGKLARLFAYVRDEIAFGFPQQGDLLRAGDVIRGGQGQCNNKTTLFLALCKAAGIPARVHFSLIGKAIQRGLFSGPAYWLMPDRISHSWLEVEVDGRWRRIDAYINDAPFQAGALAALKRRRWRTGFSVALPKTGDAPTQLDLDREQFVQMEAVTDDHGTWDDPADYYATAQYRNRPGRLKLWLYRRLVGGINRKVQALRDRGAAEARRPPPDATLASR